MTTNLSQGTSGHLAVRSAAIRSIVRQVGPALAAGVLFAACSSGEITPTEDTEEVDQLTTEFRNVIVAQNV